MFRPVNLQYDWKGIRTLGVGNVLFNKSKGL